MKSNTAPTYYPSVNVTFLEQLMLACNFLFELNCTYVQIHGTITGTHFAAMYAFIFIEHLEKYHLNSIMQEPHIYVRHIGDIFFIWKHGREHLNQFITDVNETHPTIKFTSGDSSTKTTFLHITIFLEHGRLVTTI